MTTQINDPARLLEDDRAAWQRLEAVMRAAGHGDEAVDRLRRLAIASRYALQQLQRHPEWIDALLGDGLAGDDLPAPDESRVDLDALKRDLRRYRHGQLVDIIYRDVLGEATVAGTLRRISDLADRLVGVALEASHRSLAAKHGEPRDDAGRPMRLDVIAMGKLGGRELNFSSDIDLICCFEQDGELDGYGRLSHQEFFARQVRLFTSLLADATADGFVYRVDLRLRPWGDSGPPVLSHAALEHYYQLHGREWEQYAMVKARVLSRCDASRRHLEAIIKPFVYRRYHDYRVFDGLAALKDKIDRQARSRGMSGNIKLGAGGIREIEFFVQAFQILRGGRNHSLQTTGIFDAFAALAAQQDVDADTIAQLDAAYRFLRALENRIQMFEDRQTHDLPRAAPARARIAAGLGYPDWDSLLADCRRHRATVSEHFNELFAREQTAEAVDVGGDFDGEVDEDRRWAFIDAAGIADADDLHRALNRFLRSKAWGFMSARARKRFNTLLPRLVERLGERRQPALVFERCMRLFSSIAGRSVYFELLYQNPPLLERITALFDDSAWIADEVSKYPMLLENLLHGGGPQRFDKRWLAERLAAQLDNVAGDIELELDTLRLFKREQTLVIAGAELAGDIDAVAVGRYLCELAEVVLDAVYRLACRALEGQYGVPGCSVDGVRRRANLAIVGYGKLGGYELHYQSDLDVIFLHDSEGEAQHTDGAKCIENTLYFARLAQKIISLTSVLTPSGKLYEVDARLRPDGSSGLLVSPAQAFLRYQLDKAWTWEHQALVRARLVAGSEALRGPFDAIRRQVLCLPRDEPTLRREVAEMRERMYRARQPPEGDTRDLKHSRGAMVDIEFMVQYHVLRHANSIGSDNLYSDNISLLNALLRLDLIGREQRRLVDIYQDYHRLLHQSVLQNRSSEVDAGLIAEQVQFVINCWNECFGREN